MCDSRIYSVNENKLEIKLNCRLSCTRKNKRGAQKPNAFIFESLLVYWYRRQKYENMFQRIGVWKCGINLSVGLGSNNEML